ncbi:class I SAM-dependent methyltransferase [bacterium]|nr:class I SAM-dependent methyltransferase [bacterium]
MPWTGNRKFISRVFNPSPTLQSNPQISRVLSMIPEGGKIADLGAGGRKITPATISIDFVKVGDTNIVADIHKVSLQDETVDCVFCTGTLEHVEYPEKVVKEIRRILKKNGIVYIDVPFIQCYHPDPVDYWRFTIKGIELICVRNGLVKIETGVNIGSASAVTWVLMAFFQSIFSNRVINKTFGTFFGILVSPIKYLDKYTIKGQNSTITPSAVYFIGTKE